MPSEMKQLRQLEEENQRLKKLGANLALDKEMLQEVMRKMLLDLRSSERSLIP